MKKLLSLLNVLTISGTVVPTMIAASSYQKKEKLNGEINYLQIHNNLNKLNRNKRNDDYFSEDEFDYIGTYNLNDNDNDSDSSFNSDISSDSVSSLEEIFTQITNHNHWLLNDMIRNTDLNLINSNSEEDIINAVINIQDSRIRPFLINNIRVVNNFITDFGALIEWEPKIYNKVNHNLDQTQEQFGVVFYVNFTLKTNKKTNILQNIIIGEQPGTSGTNQRILSIRIPYNERKIVDVLTKKI